MKRALGDSTYTVALSGKKTTAQEMGRNKNIIGRYQARGLMLLLIFAS